MLKSNRRVASLKLKHLGLLIEGMAALVWARLMLWMLSFHSISRWLDRPVCAKFLSQPERKAARRNVRWAIARSRKILPGEWTCFPNALAAYAMLKRRGVPTTLIYGVKTLPDNTFESHVWLVDDKAAIMGCGVSHSYAVLARFPKTVS